MSRRIYFVIPDVKHARRVVKELEDAGVPTSHLHTLGNSHIDLTGLPVATEAQRTDRVWFWERFIWNGDLVIFFLAFLGLGIALANGSLPGAVAAVVVMLASFLLGARFAIKVPHAHLDEVKAALAHGELILLADVPKGRVREIEQLVSRHHPEVGVGGIGWSMPALGIN